MKTKPVIKCLLISALSACFALSLTAAIDAALAWEEPGCVAPGCNKDEPINIGDTAQEKVGKLMIDPDNRENQLPKNIPNPLSVYANNLNSAIYAQQDGSGYAVYASGRAKITGDLEVDGNISSAAGSLLLGHSGATNDRLSVKANNSSSAIYGEQNNASGYAGYFSGNTRADGKMEIIESAWIQRESSRNWNKISMSASGQFQAAVEVGGYIYASSDYGGTWTQSESSRNWNGISMSASGKHRTAVVSGGRIYVSSSHGSVWTQKESSRSWSGVSVSANDGMYQTAIVYDGRIYVSSDFGNTWTQKENSRYWSGISMSGTGQLQIAVASGGYIYVSSDFGNTWTQKESSRSWSGVSISASGQLQTAVASGGYIYVSSDFGNTWTQKESSRDWNEISVSANDGMYQTAVVYNGHIYVSFDGGNTWTPKESSRKWAGVAVSADGMYQTAAASGEYIYTALSSFDQLSIKTHSSASTIYAEQTGSGYAGYFSGNTKVNGKMEIDGMMEIDGYAKVDGMMEIDGSTNINGNINIINGDLSAPNNVWGACHDVVCASGTWTNCLDGEYVSGVKLDHNGADYYITTIRCCKL